MANEAPFDLLGVLVDEPRAERTIPLYGGEYENAFTVASRAFGEWRNWRELLENNGIADPLDLQEVQTKTEGVLTTDEGVDLTAELGVPLRVLSASEGTTGDVTLVVEDVAQGEFTLQVELTPGAPGPPVTLLESALLVGNTRVVLEGAGGSGFVQIEFDIDTWLVLWLARCITLTIQVEPTRFQVTVPTQSLGTAARGETQ